MHKKEEEVVAQHGTRKAYLQETGRRLEISKAVVPTILANLLKRLPNLPQLAYNQKPRPRVRGGSGGTGIRAGFRILWPKGRVGSTPTFRTKISAGDFALSERSESKGHLPPGWCCYLLLCADRSYYCGITSNLGQRLWDHACGRGSGYTKGIKPVALLWYECHEDRSSAARRERQLKKWSHAKKKALVEGRLRFKSANTRLWLSLD